MVAQRGGSDSHYIVAGGHKRLQHHFIRKFYLFLADNFVH
jgi:hypothetical protein